MKTILETLVGIIGGTLALGLMLLMSAAPFLIAILLYKHFFA